jgi:tetratricopeptide (TPR) repeat protein
MPISLPRYLLLLTLTGVSSGQVMTVPAPAVSSQAAPAPSADAQARAQIVADLKARNFTAAVADAKALLARDPNNVPVNKLAGLALLDLQNGAAALPYFQKALELAPSDVTTHELLVQAYAQMGDAKNRDAQRAILHGYHSDSRHPDFARAVGFLVETLRVGDYLVQGYEFYEPYGKFNDYYRFNVFNSDGVLLRYIALESDDADQAMFRQQHPTEAAAGERRFSLDVYGRGPTGEPTQALIAFVDGQPNYDMVRTRVVKFLQGDMPGPPPAAPAPLAK